MNALYKENEMNDYNDDRKSIEQEGSIDSDRFISVEDLEEFADFDEDNSRIIMEMLECIDLE
jgi:hypothetical protein